MQTSGRLDVIWDRYVPCSIKDYNPQRKQGWIEDFLKGGWGGGGGLMVMRGAWLKGAIEAFNYHVC